MTPRTSERGFALAVSIFALVIIAALITGVFFAARQEMKIGEHSMSAQQAFSAADAGINHAIAKWDVENWNSLATNATKTFGGTLPSGSGSWTGTIKRLNPELFFVQVTGTDKHSISTRTLGALSRLLFMQMSMRGAITTRGQLKIGGSSEITGVDTNPTGWGCPATDDTMPGIATRDSTLISTSGCSSYTCVKGSPRISNDTTINDSTFLKFGDLTWAQLVSMANKRYAGSYGPASDFLPVVTGGLCDKSVMDNWGDPMNPTGPCGGYFPIIYVPGDFKATGGYGQGILIVEGNMDVQGGWQFFGPVIVKGTITTQGTGGHFNGGVLAANIELAQDVILGSAVVTYSSCALFRAMQANSPGRWIRQRSWVDLF